MTVDFEIIGKRIKAFRKQQNMTQADLADKSGLTNVYISYVETGKKGVSLEALMKIANALGLSSTSPLLDDLPARLPKAYRQIMELLVDCCIDELEQIRIFLSDYIKMLRTEKELK
jgi:transcriptional regulator with XRE-family HTH domain